MCTFNHFKLPKRLKTSPKFCTKKLYLIGHKEGLKTFVSARMGQVLIWCDQPIHSLFPRNPGWLGWESAYCSVGRSAGRDWLGHGLGMKRGFTTKSWTSHTFKRAATTLPEKIPIANMNLISRTDLSDLYLTRLYRCETSSPFRIGSRQQIHLLLFAYEMFCHSWVPYSSEWG